MASSDTKERIIEAAERLFAESGFNGTSLRQLTQAAQVNLAAVNYHFGSKENLIQDVFKRRLDLLNRHRRQDLDRLDERHDGQPPLDGVLRAFIAPALSMSADAANGGSPFVRVLARAYVEYREELRAFLSEHYGDLNRRFFQAIARHLTHLSDEQVFLRIDFMIGALTYAMADFGVAKRPPGTGVQAFWDEATEELVRFARAGLLAPGTGDA
ncbi:MAG: TetR family transcriptional regulator [Xanthomonadales bacterium]|nr:TetR family transcriptional regulator [Xanthomonadales bacterium]